MFDNSTNALPTTTPPPPTTTITGPQPNSVGDFWTRQDGSNVILLLAINSATTLIISISIACCLVWRLRRRERRREERDKSAGIMSDYYWCFENEIASVLSMLDRMRETSIFRDVSELHVLAFKVRFDAPKSWSADDSEWTSWRSPERSGLNAVNSTLRRLRRLFETLTMQLPCKGKCPERTRATCGHTIYTLVINTALLWNDEQAPLVRILSQYFAGRNGVDNLNSLMLPDEELETLVLNRIPYVDNLMLLDEYVVLRDVEVTDDDRLDLRGKIRYIDVALARGKRSLHRHQSKITNSYYATLDICIKMGFCENKTYFPDVVDKLGEQDKLGECVALLRHLLRMMARPGNLCRLQNDDRFFQIIMSLHETLYSCQVGDGELVLRLMKRVRDNLTANLCGLSDQQLLLDCELTKAKLEQIELELYRHLKYLALKQTQHDSRNHEANPQKPSSVNTVTRIKSISSESSIYTMALSSSSFTVQRQTSLECAEDQNLLGYAECSGDVVLTDASDV